MGILSRILGESKPADTERENFVGPEDLSDEVTVMLVDPWPPGKPLIDYELAFLLDQNIADPVILQCPNGIAIPEGTKIFPYEDMISSPWQNTTYTLVRGLLLDSEVAELAGPDHFIDMPDAMQGGHIGKYEREEEGILEALVAAWGAYQEVDKED